MSVGADIIFILRQRRNIMSKKKPVLHKANQVARNIRASELESILRDRRQSNASGAHLNPAEKRARTRSASLKKSLKDFD